MNDNHNSNSKNKLNEIHFKILPCPNLENKNSMKLILIKLYKKKKKNYKQTLSTGRSSNEPILNQSEPETLIHVDSSTHSTRYKFHSSSHRILIHDSQLP